MTWVFWICLVGAVYSYLIYPLLLALVPKRRNAKADGQFYPRVTLVIACRNEAKRLREKIQNALAARYADKEILVASDASDDASDSIALDFKAEGVRLVRSPERRGKEYAQGLAVAAATGEIIVFTDAGTELPPDSIQYLIDTFRDPSVGAVSSEDRFLSRDGEAVGEGAYVRYEMMLRRLESERAGLVGMSGSFFAVRKSILTSWDSTVPSDFACAMLARKAGMFAVADPRVNGIYRDVADPAAEYGRKVRTAIRGMTAVVRKCSVLNPVHYGLFSFQVWSHKVMRWLVPWWLIGVLFSSWWLMDEGLMFRVAFWLQVFGYLLALLVHFFPVSRTIAIFRLGYYFVQVNVALAVAGVLVLTGRRIVVWNPSTRH